MRTYFPKQEKFEIFFHRRGKKKLSKGSLAKSEWGLYFFSKWCLKMRVFSFHFQSSWYLFHLTFSLLLSFSPFPPFLCLSLSLFFFLGVKQQQKNIYMCLLRRTFFLNNDEFIHPFSLQSKQKISFALFFWLLPQCSHPLKGYSNFRKIQQHLENVQELKNMNCIRARVWIKK